MWSSTLYQAFQKLADRLVESTDRDSAQQSMADIAEALNLSSFAVLHFLIIQGGPPTLISIRDPGQHTIFKYASVDPVVREAIRYNQPFQWGLGFGLPVRSEREREIFEEAVKFGIRYGFTFPIHDDNGPLSGAELCDRRPSSQF
ncbi:hypothetical protein ACVWZZ_005791 [Bradyrhizobium sp. LM6.10]